MWPISFSDRSLYCFFFSGVLKLVLFLKRFENVEWLGKGCSYQRVGYKNSFFLKGDTPTPPIFLRGVRLTKVVNISVSFSGKRKSFSLLASRCLRENITWLTHHLDRGTNATDCIIYLDQEPKSEFKKSRDYRGRLCWDNCRDSKQWFPVSFEHWRNVNTIEGLHP